MKKLFALMLLAGSAVGVWGQAAAAPVAKPDFTGTWKMSMAKSDFGQVPPPSSEINVIAQTGDDVKLAVTQANDMGTQDYTLTFKAGGPESVVAKDVFPASAQFTIISSKAEWQGKVLLLAQKATYQSGGLSISTRWTLSDDGKLLTKVTSYSLDLGNFTTTTVYEKA